MFFLELFEVLSWLEETILQEREEQVLGLSFRQVFLSDQELEALNRLSKNKNLVVQKADKGNSVVLSDCNGTRTHNHLVRKRTLNHLAKLTVVLVDRDV